MTRPGARGFQCSKVTSSHRENAKRRGGAGCRQNPQHHAAINPLLAYPRLTTKIHEWRIDEAMPGNCRTSTTGSPTTPSASLKSTGLRLLAIGRKSSALVTGSYKCSATPAWETGKKSWAAFQADPDWQWARAESEINGPLVVKTYARILRPTAYSPKE
jgi:hypothetical protein